MDMSGRVVDQMQALAAIDVDSLDREELLASTLELEKARAMLDAASMRHLEAVQRRQLFAGVPGFRNGKLFVAHETRQSRNTVGHLFRRAETVLGVIPDVWDALAAGEITSAHVDVLARLAERRELFDALVADIGQLLDWARCEPWPIFTSWVAIWAELNDPTDPQDLDDRNFDQRGIIWGQGVDGEVLAELRTTAINWEQVLEAARPLMDVMFQEDWAAAKQAADLAGVEVCADDVPRSDRQRFHDAVMTLIRGGVGQADPGASFEVGVVVDAETLRREAERQADTAAGDETEAGIISAAEVEDYRCETRSGLTLTPSMALLATISGTVRRFVLHADSLDVDISKQARLFKGPHRQALIIRDRYCVADGCQTRAHRCEADHIARHTDGGVTSPSNGQMRCRPCHRHKTRLESLGLWPPN